MKKESYVKFYKNEDNAINMMKRYNKFSKRNDLRVVIDGPDDNFAVVDFKTAYDMCVPYKFA